MIYDIFSRDIKVFLNMRGAIIGCKIIFTFKRKTRLRLKKNLILRSAYNTISAQYV